MGGLDVKPPREPSHGVDLDRVWIGVIAQLWRRNAGWLERLAGRLLRSPGLARALVTTPSLLLPWLISSTVILGVGAIVTFGTGQPLVAIVAPAVTAAGIAYAYGPGMDPAWELTLSMAVSDRMVLLVRATAVFGFYAVLGLAASTASAASGKAAGITFGWLVPMAAVSALALATATLTKSANTGVAAGLLTWAAVVLITRSSSGELASAVTAPALLLPYLAITGCCAGVVLFACRTSKETSWKQG
jgi:hypothetical protein